ncbi:hypothetical protein [Marinobacterium jannaschii]|uniref:hypothetical protein n=1 Tax=Marinobacterium jannaschii TaxID=64970 RepID=UPI000486E9C6|nr:hypothetical protein [Marinobacterium jannaschii]
MTMKQTAHAQNVVSSFKARLSPEQVASVGEAHFDELSLLIESAISTAVLEEMEKAADKVESLAHGLRHFAEHFDN